MKYTDIRTFAKPSTPEEGELRKKQHSAIRIKEWVAGFLKRTDIKKNSNGSYDVGGDVDITDLGLKSIQELGIRFGKVGGNFDCKTNQLKNLQGGPSSVGGRFSCVHNQLISLQGSPSSVGGGFYCGHNQLPSLQGGPSSVGKDFDCDSNQLPSLQGSPSFVGRNFYCDHNQLASLQGCPSSVGGVFGCNDNKKKFTKEEVRAVCKVKDNIYV